MRSAERRMRKAAKSEGVLFRSAFHILNSAFQEISPLPNPTHEPPGSAGVSPACLRHATRRQDAGGPGFRGTNRGFWRAVESLPGGEGLRALPLNYDSPWTLHPNPNLNRHRNRPGTIRITITIRIKNLSHDQRLKAYFNGSGVGERGFSGDERAS